MDQSRLLILIDPLVYENGRLSEKFQGIIKHGMRYLHENSIEALKSYLAQPHNNEFIVKVFSVTTVPHIDLENPYFHQTTATIQYTLEYRPNEEEPFIFIAKQNPNERFPASKTNLIDWLTLSESCNRIRDKLESEHIKAVYKNTSIHSIDQLTWSEEKNWSRLLVDGKFYHMQTNSPAAESVFFEKESVNKVCAEFIEHGNNKSSRNMVNDIDLDQWSTAEKLYWHAQKDPSILSGIKSKKPISDTRTNLEKLATTKGIHIVNHKDFQVKVKNKENIENVITRNSFNSIVTMLAPMLAQNGKMPPLKNLRGCTR